MEAVPTTLTLRLTGQYRNLDGDARIFRANAIEQGTNNLIGLNGGDFDRDKVATDGLNFQKLKTWNMAGSIEYDFGPATLYSITSYWHGNLKSRGDIDGGSGCSFCGPGFTDNSFPGFIPFAAQSQDNIPSLDQFTQEVRIASNNSGGPRLPGRRFLLQREPRHRKLRFRLADRDRSFGNRQPAPGQRSIRHFRVGQL